MVIFSPWLMASVLIRSKIFQHLRIYVGLFFYSITRGHRGRVVTLLRLTSETGVWFLAWPQVGKLVVACRWSAVYSTEP